MHGHGGHTLYKGMHDGGSGARMWRGSPLNETWMEPPRQEKDGGALWPLIAPHA